MDTEKKITALIEIWKETIGVQKHFNDLSLRVRNYLVTILGAIIAAVAYLYKENIRIRFLEFEFNSGLLVLFAGLILLFAIMLMDKRWYHELLKASVKTGVKLEEEIKMLLSKDDDQSELQFDLLTTNIGNESRKVVIKPFKKKDNDTNERRDAYFDSSQRMNIFYSLLLLSYSIFFVSFWVGTIIQGNSRKVESVISDKYQNLKFYDTVTDPETGENLNLWIKE